jgi:CHAP domain
MRAQRNTLIAGMLLVCATGADARSSISREFGGGPMAALPGTLECVPFARDTSGIRIYGDAHTWWRQAAGKYARGSVPKPGAVLAIRPHNNSTSGHVATVSRIVDARTILISHANWSSPGQIERNVTAMDVSPMNDWSEVRVWYAPIQNLGAAHWPVAGFIYNAKPESKLDKVQPEKAQNVRMDKPGKAGSTLTKFVAPRTTLVRFGSEPVFAASTKERKASTSATARKAVAKRPAATPRKRKDPIGAIIAGAY